MRPEGSAPDADGFELSFLELNPPDHTRLRRLVAPAFSPKQVAGYRPRIEQTVHRLLDDASGTAASISSRRSPRRCRSRLSPTCSAYPTPTPRTSPGATIGSALDAIKSLAHARTLMAANAHLDTLSTGLFELRRREPAEDVISRIVAAQGEQIQPHEMTVWRGQPVLTLIGGANRDPLVYDDPAQFDIHRRSSVQHLAFSSGIHYCLGQPLARLETSIALAALAERLPDLRRAGRVVRRNAATIRGPLRLPVTVG